MKILILICLGIISLSFIGKKIFSSAKRNLYKDQASWSGREIKIKRNMKTVDDNSNQKNNYLKLIAIQSENYLEEQADKNIE